MCRETIAMSSSSSRREGHSSKPSSNRPAFQGSTFDKYGYCLKHEDVALAEEVMQDGKLLWKEIKMNCPKCQSEHHRSRRVTSLGGKGRIKRGHNVHGQSNPLRETNLKGRHMDKEFDTPFDDKGRCHHHKQVQMASKKVRGGWKILMKNCPKCVELKWEDDVASVSSAGSRSSRGSRNSRNSAASRGSRGGGASVVSKRSVSSRTTAVTSSGKFDKNGCCTKHPHMQVAKKKLLGGWKELRDCPKCVDPNYDDMNDNASFSSRKSTSSRRSGRSNRSGGSRKGGTKTSRYAGLPFDDEGYCHAHPSVKLAKKKTLGGWKVMHEICPDCAKEAGSESGSRASSNRSRSSRKSSKSGTGRYYDPSEASHSEANSKASSSSRKKIRVKDMKFTDEDSKDGRYTGDVNEDHQPHGQGKMKYKDGSSFNGVWLAGSQVHGKKSSSSKSGWKASKSDWKSSSDPSVNSKAGTKVSGNVSNSNTARRGSGEQQQARRGSGEQQQQLQQQQPKAQPKAVRKMKWMDMYGDPGEYTGEVDSSQMPHGKGSMKYDHGLVQDGLWSKGMHVEGSDVEGVVAVGNGGGGGGRQKTGQRSGQRSNRSSGGGKEKQRVSSRGSRDP